MDDSIILLCMLYKTPTGTPSTEDSPCSSGRITTTQVSIIIIRMIIIMAYNIVYARKAVVEPHCNIQFYAQVTY